MRRCAYLLALAALLPTARAAAADSCVTCHAELPEPLGPPVAAVAGGVHGKAGLSCVDCHGGDPSDPDMSAMDETKGFVGRPAPADVPQFCGRCHADEDYMRRFDPAVATDQLAQYRTSVHGHRLAAGDAKVATCISCHGVHGILRASDAQSPVYKMNVARTCARCHADAAHMAGYGIPIDQLGKYQRSVHGQVLLVERDVAAPTCNDCHGNHGAFPPGADSVAAVCGQCHAFNKELFVASPHEAAFAHLGLPQCVVCHGNHDVSRVSDEMLGVGATAVCIGCHAADSAGYLAAERMRAAVDRLREGVEAAGATLERASAVGMEVSEAEFSLREAREALVTARTQVHALDPEVVEKVVGKGLKIARGAEYTGDAALVELRQRRWMALIPLGAIAIVALLLYRWVRRLDASGGPPSGA